MHAAKQTTLRPVYLGEQGREPLGVVRPAWPVIVLPDVEFISAFHAVIVLGFHRTVNLFAAFHAAFKASIHRNQATALYASTNCGGCFLGLPVFMSMHTHCV